MRSIHHTSLSKTEFCKHCGKPQLLYWFDKNELSGQSETFYRDMHKDCYELVYNIKVKSLQQLNQERKLIR